MAIVHKNIQIAVQTWITQVWTRPEAAYFPGDPIKLRKTEHCFTLTCHMSVFIWYIFIIEPEKASSYNVTLEICLALY